MSHDLDSLLKRGAELEPIELQNHNGGKAKMCKLDITPTLLEIKIRIFQRMKW